MLKLRYGDVSLPFHCIRKPKANNKLLIKVQPDLSIWVYAPENSTDDEVVKAVNKRGRWIYKQVAEFSQQNEHLTQRQYISGETHYYLGKQYLLKVIATTDEAAESVKLKAGKLEVTLNPKGLTTASQRTDKIKKLLFDWYKTRAKHIFNQRLDLLLEQTLWVEAKPPMRLLNMKTQWGSCSPQGRLTLNPNLVKAPTDCIDYVLLHELCHLKEHNHSENFYRLMQQIMPNWKSIKERLDSNAGRYLIH